VDTSVEPTALVEYVCVTDDHLRLGRAVQDQRGHMTINEGKWAYCTAGRKDEPHDWRRISPRSLPSIRHAELARMWQGKQNP